MFCQENNCSRSKVAGRDYCFDHIYVCSAENCSKRISVSEQTCSVHQYMTCQVQNCNTKIGKPKEIEKISYWGGFFGIHTEEDKQNFYRREEALKRSCLDHKINFALYGCKDLTCYELNRKVNDNDYCLKHAKVCNGDYCSKRISSSENYCLNCQEKQEQNKLKSLVKQKTNLNNPVEVIRFETDWNKNLLTIINSTNSNYSVFLLVYDGRIYLFPLNHSETKWGISARKVHNYLSDAQAEASWLRERMKYESNPILYVHPKVSEYVSFSELVRELYVKEYHVGYTEEVFNFWGISTEYHIPNDLENYIKPLDIIKIEKSPIDKWINYFHFGIYLGKNKQEQHEIFDLGDNAGAKIRPWAENRDFMDGAIGHIIAYRFLIPFKNYKTIIGQAVWAKDNNFRNNQYCLANRNCEHLANSIILGINYSKQVYERPLGTGLCFSCFICKNNDGSITNFGGNNNKGSTIKLTNEITETNNFLNWKSDYETRELEKRYEAQIEAPIKTGDCIIM